MNSFHRRALTHTPPSSLITIAASATEQARSFAQHSTNDTDVGATQVRWT